MTGIWKLSVELQLVGKTKIAEKNLLLFYCVHHKSHFKKNANAQRKAGEYPLQGNCSKSLANLNFNFRCYPVYGVSCVRGWRALCLAFKLRCLIFSKACNTSLAQNVSWTVHYAREIYKIKICVTREKESLQFSFHFITQITS